MRIVKAKYKNSTNDGAFSKRRKKEINKSLITAIIKRIDVNEEIEENKVNILSPTYWSIPKVK